MPPRLLSQALMPPPATRSGQTGEPKWAATARTPYHVEARNHQAPRRSTTHMSASDISMPDYSHSVTPTSSRDPSLHDVHQPFDGSFPQQPSQFEEFIAALSPAKASGTQAPPTTRVSSAANSPPSTALRQSEGPEVRVISYHTQPRATSLTTLDAPPPSARGPSELSMNPRLFELEAGEMEARPRIVATPSKEVKGRKEGKSNEVDPLLSTDARKTLTGSGSRRPKSSRNASENHAIPESDGKRKRVSMTPIPNVLSEMSDGPGSSPSRKVSKKGLQDRVNSSGDSPQYPGTVVRAPLGTLHNI
ncbi:MAG: hypothetical protein LQ346_000130 [Caloplaca aetnensis]|nr:MAG: hypothetical protein LQ346_000130 [Caloplaca aetnensis]